MGEERFAIANEMVQWTISSDERPKGSADLSAASGHGFGRNRAALP